MTAVIALVLTLLMTLVLWYFGFWAVGLVMMGIAYMFYHSYKKKETNISDEIVEALRDDGDLSEVLLFHSSTIIPSYADILHNIVE